MQSQSHRLPRSQTDTRCRGYRQPQNTDTLPISACGDSENEDNQKGGGNRRTWRQASSTRSPNPLPAFGGRSLTFRQQIWRSEPECRLAFAAESTDRLPHPSCLGIAPQARHQIQRDPSHRDRRPPSLARAPNARQLEHKREEEGGDFSSGDL